MENSKFLSLNTRDFLKGLIVAIVSAVLTFAYDALAAGELFSESSLKKIGFVALAALLSYLLKNLFTNTSGEIFTPERK